MILFYNKKVSPHEKYIEDEEPNIIKHPWFYSYSEETLME